MNLYEPQPTTENNSRKKKWFLLGGCLLLFLCLSCTAVLSVSAFAWAKYGGEWLAGIATAEPAQSGRNVPEGEDRGALETAVPAPTRSRSNNASSATATPTSVATVAPTSALDVNPPDEIDQQPLPERAHADLDLLLETDYPANDYYETSLRLGLRDLGPRTIMGKPFQLGDTHTFYNGTETIEAELVAITENTYFWVADSLELDPVELTEAANRFENEYLPQLTNLFGDVWNPGIDNDPRLSVLHADTGAGDELGRFNSEDEYPATVFTYSNEQELIYLNMSELELGSDLYFGTLVHEFQHLIQWYVDPSEAIWLNEGLSQLAEIYLGYEDTATTIDYLQNSETQLNGWNYEEDVVYAHYAGAYLFSVYMWEQLGEAAIQELSRHPANGMAAVRAILQGFQPDTTLQEFTAAWAAANFLDDPNADPRYHYESLNLRRPSIHESVDEGETLDDVFDLDQFGVHYISLNELRGETTITFVGDTAANVINDPPRSGERMWFAPAVSETNAHLTAAFDLTQLNEATLTYAVWFDLEDDYDYAYVSISADGGETWELLMPNHFRAGEYGPAYNGRSRERDKALDGWLKESISLDEYTGSIVSIRFDVITDSNITGQGFAVDDIAIPELSYATDVEDGPDGWQASGFVPVGWQIPQLWTVQLIEEGPAPTVTTLPLNGQNQGQWTIDIGKGGGTLVIMPQTPFISAQASYWLRVEQE